MLKARREGWRSRAVFKLEQIATRERLLRQGMTCIDLGAAPGGWSQYVSERLRGDVRIVAVDIIPMDSVASVDFIQGDFNDDAIVEQLLAWLGGGKFDLIISDIAPNLTGIASADQASSIHFLELALDTVCRTLKNGGTFVAKMFQGAGSEQYVKQLRTHFEKVAIRKPAASRKESREVYLVAKGFKG